MSEPPASIPGTQSVRRALAVLTAFDDRNPEWSATDLAGELELNRTTVYRLLRALEHAGFLRRDPEGDAFRLGPEALALGARAARASDLRAAARQALEALAADVGESATLEVLTGAQTLVVDEAPGPAVLGPSTEVGTRWPAHATSTGKVLLAWRDDDGGASGGEGGGPTSPSEPLTRYTERTLATVDELREALARVRRRGVATADGELEEGYVAAAAPVRDATGSVVAAVSVAGPASRLDPDRLDGVAERVREAGRRISAELGAPGGQAPRLRAAGGGAGVGSQT